MRLRGLRAAGQDEGLARGRGPLFRRGSRLRWSDRLPWSGRLRWGRRLRRGGRRFGLWRRGLWRLGDAAERLPQRGQGPCLILARLGELGQQLLPQGPALARVGAGAQARQVHGVAPEFLRRLGQERAQLVRLRALALGEGGAQLAVLIDGALVRVVQRLEEGERARRVAALERAGQDAVRARPGQERAAVELLAQGARFPALAPGGAGKEQRPVNEGGLVRDLLPVLQDAAQGLAVLLRLGAGAVGVQVQPVLRAEADVAQARDLAAALGDRLQQAARGRVVRGQALGPGLVELGQLHLRAGFGHGLLLLQLHGAAEQALGGAAVGPRAPPLLIHARQGQAGLYAQLRALAVLLEQLAVERVARLRLRAQGLQAVGRLVEHGAVAGERGVLCGLGKVHARDLAREVEARRAGGGLLVPGLGGLG